MEADSGLTGKSDKQEKLYAVFIASVFIVFHAVVFSCYYAARKRRVRNMLLLLFSLVFYACGEPMNIILIRKRWMI